METQLAARSRSQEESDLGFETITLDFGGQYPLSTRMPLLGSRTSSSEKPSLTSPAGFGTGTCWRLPLPACESQLLNCQEFCKLVVKHCNY